ncbi:MAG: class I SAM-dependent methyltransferase [Pseudohongiellaceae bacterium]
MSGFSIDWLDLREDADHRGRDSVLLEQAKGWVAAAPSSDKAPVIVDLGAGTGSTLRAFSAAGMAPASLTWRLVDNDRELLDEARRRHGSIHQLETCPADLAQVAALPLTDTRLITASALFDLVSPDFIETLATALQTRCQHTPVGVYAALNYNGVTQWTPAHPLDDVVLDAFNRDQRRDKGFGPALGPDAASCMEKAFSNAGFAVHSASSPWGLSSADRELVSALIRGIASAVAQAPRLDQASLDDWADYRLDNVSTGTCTVGHTDILALPTLAWKR